MESLLGGFQLPFQRRLTKMYTDTKSSYDFVKESLAPAEDPTLTALHRKLRIQKDRLVSWGLAWSDSSQSPDIDESLSRAGLGDVVGSVMETIKDILAEAEPLWQSSRGSHFGLDGASDRASEKLPSISWDRSRFEDLVKDLTISIDTLYDLSGSRQILSQKPVIKDFSSTALGGKDVVVIEEQKLFESTRMQTPQQIDPDDLVDPKSLEYPSGQPLLSPELLGVMTNNVRKIMYMTRQISSTNPWKLDGPPPMIPVLVEYASFDPIYANTGISPSMARFEKLFAGLRTFQEPGKPDFGALNLVGYFEDSDNARFGLVYDLPKRFGSLDVGTFDKYGLPYIASLSNLISHDEHQPSLEAKYRLAYNIATSLFELHAKGVVHGDVGAKNVVFFEQHSPDPNEDIVLSLLKVNVRRSFLISFDLFPDKTSNDTADGDAKWYRHPLDPRMIEDTPFTFDSRSLELYSLGQLLIEIALWVPSRELAVENLSNPEAIASLHKQIAVRCGSSYLKAVQACWSAVESDDRMTSHARPDVALQQVYGRVLSLLERCCMIDDGSEGEDSVEVRNVNSDSYALESVIDGWKFPSLNIVMETLSPDGPSRIVWALSDTLQVIVDRVRQQTASSSAQLVTAKPSTSIKKVESISKEAAGSDRNVIMPDAISSVTQGPEMKAPTKLKPKPRRFPLNKISQEHLDEWHRVLMPSINQALRGFYRKYPESVEISLESVGETSQQTKPTIVVICTSIGKVRSILRKNFDYDASTYGLLVCRGVVVRSRKNAPKRSMAGEDDSLMKPMNSAYQERPTNGASIGAYVDGQHLMPVSFGGLIKVDDKTYGLTVHHMLDDPNDEEPFSEMSNPALRSSDQQKMIEGAMKMLPTQSVEDDESGYELSETGSDTSSILSMVEYSDDLDEPRLTEVGDIEGIPKDCGDGYVVTQPAYDDVDEIFLASEEGREDDHLDTFALGEIYASSGIRRRYEDGLTHEIDWALFEFNNERLPKGNFIPGGEKHCTKKQYPADYMPSSKLHDLEVHGMARTSGLQTGRISPGMVVLKIFGRQTPSDSFQVHGGLGIPGDSGAWVIDNEQGWACGHVLAWSSRKKVAYICPMEIILKDIAEELGAKSVTFPTAQSQQNALLDAASKKSLDDGSRRLLEGERQPQTPVLNETLGIASASSTASGKSEQSQSVKYSMAAEPENEAIVSATTSLGAVRVTERAGCVA